MDRRPSCLAGGRGQPCRGQVEKAVCSPVGFYAEGPSQQLGDEHLGKCWLVMEDASKSARRDPLTFISSQTQCSKLSNKIIQKGLAFGCVWSGSLCQSGR
jgi:hypothetical protein